MSSYIQQIYKYVCLEVYVSIQIYIKSIKCVNNI